MWVLRKINISDRTEFYQIICFLLFMIFFHEKLTRAKWNRFFFSFRLLNENTKSLHNLTLAEFDGAQYQSNKELFYCLYLGSKPGNLTKIKRVSYFTS